MELYYEFDLHESPYESFNGKNFKELEKLLNEIVYKDKTFKDCYGYININHSEISIVALKCHGVYINYYDGNTMKLSLRDIDRLDVLIDVWQDDNAVSEGLFIEPEKAWNVIIEYISSGKITENINWTTEDEIESKNGNYFPL